MKQGDLTDLKPDEIKRILQYEVNNGTKWFWSFYKK
jgi:hypothetical protein